MTGPKMILDQVEAAERVVADAVQQMQAVSQQLQAQAGASLTAMKAPAGQITSSNYDAHSGAGRALAETLGQLQRDLTADPAGAARRVRPGHLGGRPGRDRRRRRSRQPDVTTGIRQQIEGEQSWVD